jgi:hypothetical protein
MMKTAVFEQQGKWWFKWWNILSDIPMAQDFDGPFATKSVAEAVRQRFVSDRRKKYPFERIGPE